MAAKIKFLPERIKFLHNEIKSLPEGAGGAR